MLDNGSARTVVHKVGIVHKKDNVGPDLARTGNRRSILQIDRQIPEGDCLRGLGSRQCGKYTGRQRLGGGEAASVFRNVSLLHKSNLFRVPACYFFTDRTFYHARPMPDAAQIKIALPLYSS